MVDVLDQASASKSFRKVIEKDNVVLARKDKSSAKRDSGLMSNWREVKLGDLGEVNRGRSRHRPRNATELYGGPYPFVQTGDIKSSGGRITSHTQTYNEVGLAQSRLWPTNTMVITIAANIAETAILTYPACFPDSVIGFIANESICDVRFVEYTFRLLRSKIQHENVGTGSVQDNINLQTLDDLRFVLPPLPEQRAIAHILGTLDDKIELNRRMNETLEAMARALFKSWFVDFDPVRAKMEGRDTGLPSHIADLFPERLVDSELGEIPEGWEVSTVGEEVTVVGGSTPSTKDRSLWGGKINWATPKDLSALSEPVLLETARQITDAGLSKIGSGLLPQGIVLLSSRAPIGYLAIAEIPVAVNQGFIAMKCESRLSNMFTWLWAQANMDTILQNANGSTFQEISKRNFRPLKIMIPKLEILSMFDKHVRLLYERVVINQRESRTLAVLRDALLPKLITGEIFLSEVEEVVEIIE